jgi:hypothetical protein
MNSQLVPDGKEPSSTYNNKNFERQNQLALRPADIPTDWSREHSFAPIPVEGSPVDTDLPVCPTL